MPKLCAPHLLLKTVNSSSFRLPDCILSLLQKVAEEEAKKNVEYDAAGNAFIDDLDEIEPERPQMSEAMKRRLRAEYTSLGGSPNAKSTNYFLYISIIISVLAVLTWLSGGCDTGIPLF